MASFFDVVDRARRLLEERGRATRGALQRELELDEDALLAVVEELVEALQVATIEGSVLVWRASPTVPEDPAGPARSPAPPEETSDGAASPAAATGGERRQLTVMFCDLVGSTELAQRIDPEALREILHEYHSVCVEATKRFDGHVAQYLGDGVLVYFGYPLAHEDDAERAIRAGLEIQRVLGERPDARRIGARIGIHTGLVVVSPRGRGKDTLALGPTTNVASRIQGAAEPGRVVVSEDTLALCRGAFVSRSIGEIPLKGITDPMALHEVERSSAVRATIGGASLRPMVGRDRELGLLLDRWRAAQEGRGHVVLVSGDPGIGKSRLVRALRDALEAERHQWLDLQCSPFTSGSAFQPLVDLFRAGLMLPDGESPEESSRRFVSGLDSLPGLPGEKVVPYLLPLLGLPPSERYPLPQTSADEQRERTLGALIQLIRTRAEQNPLVLVAEDLHWADPSTLEYLGRLVEQTPAARLLLVLTFRPEFRAPFAGAHVSALELERLSDEMTREMIATAVGGRLPAPVLEALEARSDGVPLFIEELANGIVSSGVMVENAGRYELRGSLKDLAIPTTLQDSLMGRLDRLSASKRVAQQASTLGREFSYELIEAVSDLDAAILRNALAQLADADIVYRRGTPPDATYTFKHALLQDTAYASQLLSTRKALHGRVAEVLEARFPRRVESEPEVIARHCAAAGAHDKALDHYERAGQLALSRLANQEASEHFGLALEALSALPENPARHQREVAIRIALGESLTVMLGFEAPRVVATFARVSELCDAVGEGPQQLAGKLGLAKYHMGHGYLLRASEDAEAILRIAEPLGIRELLVVGNLLVGSAAMTTRSGTESSERLGRALEIAAELDFPPPATPYDPDLVAIGHATHASALCLCGQLDRALAAVHACRARVDAIDHEFTHCQALCAAANSCYVLDDPELTRSLAEEVLSVGEGRGYHSADVNAVFLRGWSRARMGEVEAGLAEAERGLELSQTTGYTAIPMLLIGAAHVCRMGERWERGNEFLDMATAAYEKSDELAYRTFVLEARARLGFASGALDAEAAERLLHEADEVAAANDNLFEQVMAWTHLAALAPHTGRVREAHDGLANRYARLTEGFDHAPFRAARAALDELEGRLGDGAR